MAATGCAACGLGCGLEREGFFGDGKLGVLILAYAPAKGEDNRDMAFTSKGYGPLFDLQGRRGVPGNLASAAWLGYAVPTAPDKAPGNKACCCLERLGRLIRTLKPRVIVTLGPEPTEALIGPRIRGRLTGTKPGEFFGKCIPDREWGCWICPTWHPSMQSWPMYRDDPNILKMMAAHVGRAFSLVDKPLPEVPTGFRAVSTAEAPALLRDIAARAEPGPDGGVDVAIDYETTGLKPHRGGHAIVAASVAWREGGTYSAIGFRWDPTDADLVDAWHGLTHGGRVKLVAHNAPFEACWTRFRAGRDGGREEWIPQDSWSWDTCVAAHVIDNTQKVGLKLHTYCEFGVIGYDDSADKYLKPTQQDVDRYGANAYNGLKTDPYVPWVDVCTYCAQDSLYTLMLRDVQAGQVKGGMLDAYRFALASTLDMAELQSAGFPVDLSRLPEIKADCQRKIDAALAELDGCAEVAAWRKVHRFEPLNIDSTKDMGELLWRIMKYTPPNGTPDCTKDTLEKLDTPFTRAVLVKRKWDKVLNTFLASYEREAVWDAEMGCHLIRPFYNFAMGAGDDDGGGPRTYRTSCDSPNFQCIPKRDKEMKKVLRSLFVAPPGWRYVEFDYRSLEVYVSEAYHRDPNMEKYLSDPDANMHTDTACDFYHRTPETLGKDERNSIKSGYVFASFYGASWKHCADYMWRNMPKYTKAHLMEDCGIDTLEKWYKQVKKADDIFWHKRFKVYDQWRREQWERYKRNGCLDTYLGFRLRAPMTPMQAGNGAIQGTGAHCLLYGLRLNRRALKDAGLSSYFVGQIHDSQVGLVKDGEFKAVAAIVWRNSVKGCNDAFPWLNLPLVVETDLADSSRCWAHMEELGAVGPRGLQGVEANDKLNKVMETSASPCTG